MDIVLSMHIVFLSRCVCLLRLAVYIGASINLHMPLVLLKGIRQAKLLTDCQTESLLLIFALSQFLFPSRPLPLSLSLCFSDAIQRCHSPSFPHWLASRLTAAVSVELEFNHCRFQQNMEQCNLEASRSVATQCDSILSDCRSLYAVYLFLMTGVSSSSCYGCFFFFP